LLTLAGHAAAAVYSVDSAFDHCRASHPEVVILDYRLGSGMNGIELLGSLRRAMPDLIGILMTSDQDYETAVSSLRAGVLEYVRKPAEPGEILAAVEKALARADELSRKCGELQKLSDEAHAAELNRSFLLSLGTEIREPLSLIMGNAELLAASAVGGSGLTANLSAIAEDVRSGAKTLLERVALAKDLCRPGLADDIESEPVAVMSVLRDLCRKLESRARAAEVRIDLPEPAAAAYVLTSKLHLRRMVHLFADSLLSIATAGSALKITADTDGGQTSIGMALTAAASPEQSDLTSSFGVALSLAHRLGIATDLRLDPVRGHALTLNFPAAGPS
ncbi:MAG: response regulator, partial [Aestuariivirga sp.]